jgi:CRISPR-associated endonuclease/helicase Cas3
MRVLVEQTEAVIRPWLAATEDAAKLHVLMGGVESERWELEPDRPAILLGTQDMLLSRALNRGYGSGRARWPMSFGLLHQDALWVLDEVQLMDVGLATSAQLSAFRWQDASGTTGRTSLRPSFAWWMSATLQPAWLETVDHPVPPSLIRIPAEARTGSLWEVQKAIEHRADLTAEADLARLVLERHTPGQLTLVVVNQVNRAAEVHRLLEAGYVDKKSKARREGAPDLRLVHSRFRGQERTGFREAFLRKEAPLPAGGRIIVATQVVEAGVDISASLLVTDLAPWSSLVQRFGRCARYANDSGGIVVLGMPKSAAPYEEADLRAATDALADLINEHRSGAPRALEAFEEAADPGLLERLYRYQPAHVLRRRDLDDLFDTTADLSGADLDISRYIRSGEERDVHVFWRALSPQFSRTIARDDVGPVSREELCPVPVGELREWAKLDGKRAVYVVDYLDPAGRWTRLDLKKIVPGMTLLLATASGGYIPAQGWSPKSSADVAPVLRATTPLDDAQAKLDRSAQAAEDDSLSHTRWKTIAVHGRETGALLEGLGRELGLDGSLIKLLSLAGRWHDAGKVHWIFQGAIHEAARREGGPIAQGRDLAKAPDGAWKRPAYPERPGFRHELASTLAILELLRRARPDHAALLGDHGDLLEALGTTPEPVAPELCVDESDPLAREILALSAGEVDLLLFLVCSHHGKVRCSWTSTPLDQQGSLGAIHGVADGDPLISFRLSSAAGSEHTVPGLTLSLAPAALGVGPRYGASWSDRVAGLLAAYGPFTLAYLEALVRAADVRASMETP